MSEEKQKEIPGVVASTSSWTGWMVKTAYETGLMVVTHTIAHSFWEIFEHGAKGFKFAEPVTYAAAFIAELVGEGVKNVSGLDRVLHFKPGKDGFFKKQAKFMAKESFEATIFTAVMIAATGVPVSAAAIMGFAASHYFSAAIKEYFRHGTEPTYHAIRCSLGSSRECASTELPRPSTPAPVPTV